jgi:Tol biopolymer transport system component
MERGFVRIIMTIVFSVLIAVSLSSCGDCYLTCGNDNSVGDNENGDDDGGGESPALPVVITLDSVDSKGNEGNDFSNHPSINLDGRYVAFVSFSSNLVANDTNGAQDIFVRDRLSGETTRVSVDSKGNEGNDISNHPSINLDGRYVAFNSYASNLVANDTNGARDIFVHDRLSGETTRVSVDSNGNEGNSNSYQASISADGRYVAFNSGASNLVANDNNSYRSDIFVHDRQSGETTRVSVDSNGNEGNGSTWDTSISADGQYVAFMSRATNLVANDNNGCNNNIGCYDIFVHDRQSGETTRVSVDSNGNEANNESLKPSISADGRYVAFYTLATNLVANDNNGHYDIFVHDQQSGETTRVSVDSNGNEANNESLKPSISADGRYVAFMSRSTNLVANDNYEYYDIFVHDQQSGETTRVSVDSNGNEANGGIKDPSISADGRYVAFWSQATNLVTLDYLCGCHIYTAPVP